MTVNLRIPLSTLVLVLAACGGGAMMQSPPSNGVPAANPLPVAEPTSSPTPAPGQAAIFITHQIAPFVTAYDENGNQVSTPGNFIGLRGAFGIAFDSVFRVLLVSFGGNIDQFDESGNPIAGASCVCPGAGTALAGMAFDSSNHTVYAANATGGSSKIALAFRHPTAGTLLLASTSGNFARPTPSSFADNVAVDSSNHHLYFPVTASVNGGIDNAFSIVSYDENGNLVPTSGSFPNLAQPEAIAFDPFNGHLYVANAANNTITVYDDQGNQVSTTGTFPSLSIPAGIALDSHNRRLYVINQGNQTLTIYDENGNLIVGCSLSEAPDPVGIVSVF